MHSMVVDRACRTLIAAAALGCGVLQAAEIEVLRPPSPIASGLDAPLTEPRPAVSPATHDHLVIGVIVAPVDDQSAWDCAALTSRDGGERWAAHRFGVDRCIDPWVAFVDAETVLFTAIEIRRDGEGDQRLELFRARSTDGGRTWTAPAAMGRAFEHPVIAIRPAAGKEPPAVLLAARRTRRADNAHPRHTVALLRSTDAGESFDALAEIYPSNAGLTTTGLALLPNGGVYVSYYDFQRNTGGFNEDGMLSGARAWGLSSTDGGRSFSVPLLIGDDCGLGRTGGGFPGYPYLTADPAGRLYHVCQRTGLDGIAFSYSDDGEAWSQPKRLDRAPPGGGRVLTPMLAASHRGVLVAWQDRRDDPECQYLYASASADGGESFGPEMRISDAPSCPATPQNGRAGRSWGNGGDYSSIATDAEGRFHVVWADARGGRFELYYQVLGIQR